MSVDIIHSLSNLIKDPELEKLELDLKAPNIFSILKLELHEIRHSNFLAWLLDPEGSHNLSNLFLKWFLKDIFSDEKVSWINEFKVESLNFRNVKILREWENIDILIVAEDFVICIENKVSSSEHHGQLAKYRKVLEQEYPYMNKAFVLLSPDGLVPEDDENRLVYITYSYSEIKKNIETVLNVYSQSISNKVKIYLQDYLKILRRDIMKEHETIEIARLIYKNHKEAIDFIFENKPDRLLEINPIIQRTVEELGYKLCSSSKGYVRFITQHMEKILPKTGQGWPLKESFAFEIDICKKSLILKTVISPGDERNREVLSKALLKVKGSKDPIGKQWLCHFLKSKKIDLTNEKYEEDNLIKDEIISLLNQNQDLIKNVETELLKFKNDFHYNL